MIYSVAKPFLVDLLKRTVGIRAVYESPRAKAKAKGLHYAQVFSLPTRNSIEITKDKGPRARVRKWYDWKHVDSKGDPTPTERRQAAGLSIQFRVMLTHNREDRVEADFEALICALKENQYIYDGRKAYYLDQDDEEQTDSKGNVISVHVVNYDFNDNQFYGNHPARVVVDVEFRGGIYPPDAGTGTYVLPTAWVSPESQVADE